jgi:hypothetical protein
MQALKILSFLLIFSFWGCDKYQSDIPRITFISNSKSILTQNNQDSTFVKFSFEDGDGDVGNDTTDNIFIRDARNGQIIVRKRIPNFANTTSYKEGELTLVIKSPCCIYPDGSSCYPNSNIPNDKTRLLIQMKDNAGNWSNEISSPEITIDCL